MATLSFPTLNEVMMPGAAVALIQTTYKPKLKSHSKDQYKMKRAWILEERSYNCVPPGFLLLEGNKSLLVKVLLVHFSNTCKLKHS